MKLESVTSTEQVLWEEFSICISYNVLQLIVMNSDRFNVFLASFFGFIRCFIFLGIDVCLFSFCSVNFFLFFCSFCKFFFFSSVFFFKLWKSFVNIISIFLSQLKKNHRLENKIQCIYNILRVITRCSG